jgi:Winged helix DNA-binding domain
MLREVKRRQGRFSRAAPTVRLSWEQVALFRAKRHRLLKRAPRGSILRTTKDVCGLHAQVLSSAGLSLWARVNELAPEAVPQALWGAGSLVKTWAMRGTLHLLPRTELPLYFAALSTYTHFLKQAWVKYFGVTREDLAKIIEAVSETLPGQTLTREELAAEIIRRTRSKKYASVLRQSWGVLLKPAAFRGQLCFAESEGQHVRFTHPGFMKLWAAPQALREVTQRFLSAYGPATRQDFATWWGESAAEAESLLESLDTVMVDVDGSHAFMLKRDIPVALRGAPAGAVRLLPPFDPYVIGAPRRGGLFPLAQKPRIFRGQGWISATLVVDGRIEGVWRQERQGRKLSLTVEPFGRPTSAVRAGVSREAESLAAFQGCSLHKILWSF